MKDDNKYIKVTPIFIHKTAKQQYHELVYTEDEGESKKILNMNIKDIKIVRELKEKSTVDNSLRELVHDKMKEFFNRGSYKSKKSIVGPIPPDGSPRTS